MPTESDLQIAPNWSQIEITCNDITIFGHDIIVNFFLCCFVFLVKFSFWSKFHVIIITGSGITTIYFYKGLARNPAIENTSI